MLNRVKQTALRFNCASVNRVNLFFNGNVGLSRVSFRHNAPSLYHEEGRCYSIMSRAKREAGLQSTDKARATKEHKEIKKRLEVKSSKALSPGIRKPISPTDRLVKLPDTFTQPTDPRLCKIALLGAANAGKSTLVNSIIGDNISVVSARAHTTRERILAVWTKENHQIVFLDTPGVIYGRNHGKMNRTLVNASWQSLIEADHRKWYSPEVRYKF
jgi:predicted GTPase